MSSSLVGGCPSLSAVEADLGKDIEETADAIAAIGHVMNLRCTARGPRGAFAKDEAWSGLLTNGGYVGCFCDQVRNVGKANLCFCDVVRVRYQANGLI